MSPSHSRHLSIMSLVTACNITDTSPVIIWQSRHQRDRQDLARHHLGSLGERSRKPVEMRGFDWDVRRTVTGSSSSNSRIRTEKCKLPDLMVEQGGYSRLREESPPGRRRGLSCSRIVRSNSRGRSRSPRRSGQPGPGILKGRSATHDGRREGGGGWKMFRICRVDQVREFSPWPEERERGLKVDEQAVGEDRGEGCHEEVESRIELEEQLGREGDKEWEDIDEKRAMRKHSAEANVCRRNVKKCNESRVAVKGVDNNTANKNSTSLPSACVETVESADAGLTNYDGNNKEFREINVAADVTEDFHGFDPQTDRNPCLLAADKYESLIDEIESEAATPMISHLQVVFSHDYQTRPVQCRHTDCPTTSLPTTLELLPLPQSGQQWLCTDHSHCLLCTDPPTSSTCVMCTLCARLYHTHHLDMEFQDKLEMELYICKLCSDPDQFTQLSTEMDDQVVEDDVVPQSSSSNLHHQLPTHQSKQSKQQNQLQIRPRPSHPYTKIKPKPVVSRGKSLQHDDTTLPPGWYRQLVRSANSRWRVVITGPDGRRFWSKSDLRKAFKCEGKGDTQWEDFDFSLFGSQGQQGK